MDQIIKGTFISIWEEGMLETPATLDLNTGEVITCSVNTQGLEHLVEELFEDENGDEHEVCPECHEYIMHTYMEPGIGHNLDEVKRCRNTDCTYVRYF